jgi:hypothetical protein
MTGYSMNINSNNPNLLQATNADFNITNPDIAMSGGDIDTRWSGFPADSPQLPMDDSTFNASLNMGMTIDETNFTWEMIGLGLEEPLPPQETIDELYVILKDDRNIS